MTKALKTMFETNPVSCFAKLTDRSIIATFNTTQNRFADNVYRFYEFIKAGILNTMEMNRQVNFDWLFTMKKGGKTECFCADEKFRELILKRYDMH